MKTTTAATLRTFNLYVLTARGAIDCGTEQGTDAADAIARAAPRSATTARTAAASTSAAAG